MLTKPNVRILFFAALLPVASIVSAQGESPFLRNAIGAFQKQLPPEKVYLHLDKPNYNFGDTIWYKAYTVIGEHHQLSALSKILYVELISPKDSLIARQQLPLTSGVGWNDIPLPPALKQGNYRIRAYTNWMRNFGPEYFYDHTVRIGGIPPPAPVSKIVQVNLDVQFFPEGGQLVNGVRSRVAFKAINSSGIGEYVKGTIQDNAGKVVADFAARHLGMGEFAFIPQSGKSYKAVIDGTGGTSFTAGLPKALNEGFTLGINNSFKDSIYVKVAVNGSTFNKQKNSTFYIIARSNGKIYYVSQSKLDGLVYIAAIEKKRFPTGIIQFTLFSQYGEPLAERIAFIQNNDTLKLKLSTASTAYTTRQPVKITLDAKGPDNNPIKGSFSMSVTNENLTGADEYAESTILNNILLTSDLKGDIEQPNYYFTNVNNKTRADLDVLMLTQGYRRFQWKQVLKDTVRVITYQPERSLGIAGILKTPPGKPIVNGKVTLIDAKENLLRDTTTDANGHFQFSNLYLTDTTNVMLQGRKENKGRNVRITVRLRDYPAITAVKKLKTETTQLSPQQTVLLQKIYTDYQQAQKLALTKNGIQLKQVDIHGYKTPKKTDLSNSSNLHGAGNADQVIMGDQLGNFINVSDCLMGKIKGVIFVGGAPINTRNSGVMSVIVDGVTVAGEHLNDINPSGIYSIEVLHSGFARSIYGSSIEGGGALIITMKHGGEDTISPAKSSPRGIIVFPFIGYSKVRTFYSPKYTTKTNSGQPDKRTTIYWQPNILTNKNGKATMEYFNNDTKGTYRVVVEGIDDNGNLGRIVYKYKVE